MVNKPDTINAHIGRRVRTLRKAKGWSRKQLAAHVGCQLGEIIKCEEGRLRLTPRRLLILAVTLDVTLNDLFPQKCELD